MKLIYLLFVIAVTYSGRLMSQTVNSPDGDIRIEFSLVGQSRHNYPEGTPMYAVSYKGKPFLLSSRLGFDVLGTAGIKSFLKVSDVLRTERRSTWKPVYGERGEYPDNYNEMSVVLEETLFHIVN